MKNTIEKAIGDLKQNTANTEIAFFGGSFTAIDREYMLSLLEATKPYIDKFKGIRISTRPDYIDDEILSVLKSYNVTSIELGAQSMDDTVLKANERGHSSDDDVISSNKIKKYGFSLGLQMMTGLYMSTPEKDLLTAKKFIDLQPDTVRIYPTVVMKNTRLADLYQENRYRPYSLDSSVDLCSKLITLFESNNIAVIRLGLHYSDSLVSNSLESGYHPAFKELCENKIFYDKFLESVKNTDGKITDVYINEKSLSKFLGQKKSNLNKLKELGYEIKINFDNTLAKYDLYIK